MVPEGPPVPCLVDPSSSLSLSSSVSGGTPWNGCGRSVRIWVCVVVWVVMSGSLGKTTDVSSSLISGLGVRGVGSRGGSWDEVDA